MNSFGFKFDPWPSTTVVVNPITMEPNLPEEEIEVPVVFAPPSSSRRKQTLQDRTAPQNEQPMEPPLKKRVYKYEQVPSLDLPLADRKKIIKAQKSKKFHAQRMEKLQKAQAEIAELKAEKLQLEERNRDLEELLHEICSRHGIPTDLI